MPHVIGGSRRASQDLPDAAVAGAAPDPAPILRLGPRLLGSKALLTAVELGCSRSWPRGRGRRDAAARWDSTTRGARLPRRTRRARDARARRGRLQQHPATDLFLDRAKPSYIGGILEMANARLYPFWGSLTEGLRTGEPQNEAKAGGDFFAALYADPGGCESSALA